LGQQLKIMPLQPPSQDLVNNIDYTAYNGITQAQLNQGFSSLIPNSNANAAIGFNLLTYDSAVGVPNVPNPALAGNAKWVNYVWTRIPFASDPNGNAPIQYNWNPSISPDATFLNWVNQNAFLVTLQGSVNTLITDVAAATDTANTALATSNAASTTANSANTVATNAATAASTAQTTATNAQTTANTAQTTATSAATNATAAVTTANNAVALISSVPVANIQPGLAGQRIRTNSLATADEYYSYTSTYSLLQCQLASGSSEVGVGATSGWVTRVINTNVQDAGGNVISLAGNTFVLKAGTYRINALVPMGVANAQIHHVARLYNASSTQQLLQGTNEADYLGATGTSMSWSKILGTFTSNGSDGLNIQTWSSAISAGGYPTSLGPTEVYTTIELEKVA
jgi:hypothetical protein